MLGETPERTVLKQEWSNCKKSKCYVNLDLITFQQKLHENINSKLNFLYTLKLPEIIRKSTFIIKKFKPPI